ncbi:MAG TPA: hypothetical protein VFS77_10820, partial [Pyrinomonadaceae bacterium]|nr:hypothetical protein [Pyrinomonadaceae bacterium]
MSTEPVSDSHLIFGDFLETLRRRGFNISVGHYLRLQKLLDRIGPQCKPHELKTLLCPIFATTEREQTRFYDEFDAFFDYDVSSLESVSEPVRESVADVERNPEPKLVHPKPVNNRKRIALVLGLLLLVFLGLAALYGSFEAPADPRVDFPTPTPTPDVVPTPTPSTIFGSLDIEASTLIRILVALLPLLLFALYELYRRLGQRQRRRQLNDREQPGIPIGFKTTLSDVYDPDSVTRLARLLRTRQRSGTLQLDIGASIAATVKALGFFTLREKSTSKPPEYLVLIDRAAFRDHQARLFYELARRLHEESVFLTCYFFEGDPRVSFLSPFAPVEATPLVRSAEAQQKLEEEARRAQRGATLDDLHDLYPGHRLLIFGEGADFVDPVTLQTVDWIKSFSHWQERAILTPRPRSLWDEHEFTLRQQFVVMPATLMGLELVAESFAIREPVSIPENLRTDKSQPPRYIDSVEGLHELRRFLGEPTFQWLCACAVHPQLQWDLTICLGVQFSTTENLVTEDNLLRLFSLPWFRTGAIPDALREKLVRELTAGSEAKVRKTIDELMARAAALGAAPEDAEVVRVPLPQEFEGTIPDQLFKRIRNVRDVAFKRFLQPQPFVMFLKKVLPESLQRLLLTPFGLRMGARVALALLVSLMFWAAFPTLASAFDFGSSSMNTNNANTNTNSNSNNDNYNVTPNSNVNTAVNSNVNPSPTPNPTPSASPTASPSASPRPTAMPSPRLSPSPSASVRPSPSPRASLIPQNGIYIFTVEPRTIRLGDKVRLTYAFDNAKNVIIVPQDGALESFNQRFARSGLESASGAIDLLPEKTTTYIITADIQNPNGSITKAQREATVTVLDDPKTDSGQLCQASNTDLRPLTRGGDTV